MRLTFLLLVLISFITVYGQQPDQIVGVWLTQDSDSKIEIKLNNKGKYEGSIIWLKNPTKDNGSPKIDDKNPDEALRTRSILGLKILDNFEYDPDENNWSNGSIYDPKSGNTYRCYIWFEEDDLNTLFVKGYIGISIIGRTVNWKRL